MKRYVCCTFDFLPFQEAYLRGAHQEMHRWIRLQRLSKDLPNLLRPSVWDWQHDLQQRVLPRDRNVSIQGRGGKEDHGHLCRTDQWSPEELSLLTRRMITNKVVLTFRNRSRYTCIVSHLWLLCVYFHASFFIFVRSTSVYLFFYINLQLSSAFKCVL